MAVLPSCPPGHFDFGARGALAGELSARGIERPLIITDKGLVEHGLVDRVRVTWRRPSRHYLNRLDASQMRSPRLFESVERN